MKGLHSWYFKDTSNSAKNQWSNENKVYKKLK